MSKEVVLFAFYDKARDSVLSERRSAEHPLYPNQTTFPTGKVNEGEALEEALGREIGEEFGVRPINPIRLGEPLPGSKGDALLFPFFISEWEGELPTTVLDKGNPLVWETLEEVSASLISTRPIIVQRIRDYLASQ